MTLDPVIDEHRVVVCVGSGGVGKTTTAAALGVRAAMRGKRVLCLTIDPAKRLANSLGLDSLHTDEQLVSKELFARHGLEARGSLSAMMVDTKRTFDELVAANASSPEVRDRILGNSLYQYMASSLAGTSEYMAMEKLHAVRTAGDWDLIVLDTPPTANALDFLDAPERMVGLVDSPAMRWFIEAFQSTGKISFNLVGKSAALILKALARFTGGEFLNHLAEFVTDFNDLFGGFKERADEVAQALRGPDVAFVLVTSPRPLAIEEALYFQKRLREADMETDAFVINAVQPLLPEPKMKSAELRATIQRAVGDDIKGKELLRKLQRALDDERTLAVADRVQAERLKTRIGPKAIWVEVPALEKDVHDLGALAQVASFLTGSAPATR
ncbi:MAG: ArsA-related P-loop ATPase, partial [Myxococcota bacterium]